LLLREVEREVEREKGSTTTMTMMRRSRSIFWNRASTFLKTRTSSGERQARR